MVRRLASAGDGGAKVGIYLIPAARKSLVNYVHRFGFFVLDMKKPYLKEIQQVRHHEMYGLPSGKGCDIRNYLKDLARHYDAEFRGPFTIGVFWKIPEVAPDVDSESDSDSANASESD